MAGTGVYPSCRHACGNPRPGHSSDRSQCDQIIQFLSQTIDWYRGTQQEQHIATEPADLGFLADNRRMAAQIARLAFDFARQEEQQRAKQSKTSTGGTSGATRSQYESLSKAAANAHQLVDSLKQQLPTVPPVKRHQFETQIADTESELGLFQARQQALHSMLDLCQRSVRCCRNHRLASAN